jgi:hypothetical protein
MTKPIQIKNEDVVRDIREAASLTHQSITEVVGEGARLVLERARRRADRRDREIDEILARVRALPRTGEDLTDADLYDEDGFPR